MIDTDQLGAFESLAEALGITVDGELNSTWFETPMGDVDRDRHGLGTMFHDDQQRDSLLQFVDDTLGAPDNDTRSGATWVPLFSESGVVVSAVVTPRTGSVLVGFGVTYDGGSTAPSASLAASVNVFQFTREGSGSVDRSGSLPDWLILGRKGGTVDIDGTLVLSTDSPAPDEPFLGGIGLGVSIPTSAEDALSLRLTLERLQLPGTDTPRNFTLDVDSLSELDDEVYDFLLGLLQAQAEALDLADPTTRRFAGLAGLLGLRRVTNVPEFPLADLIERGTAAFTDWISSIVDDGTAFDAWLGELAGFLDATPRPDRHAVTFSIDDVDISVGLRLDTAAGDGLVLVPWVECSYGVRNGAEVAASVDLLAYDTTSRTVRAFPALNAHAVFGSEAGASGPLLSGDPRVGTIRTGISLLDGRPAFALTLYDVVVAGVSHDSLDLSSPDAALDTAVDIATEALNALDAFGRPGRIAMQVFGLQPPGTVSPVSVPALFADPIAAVRDYWQRLITDSAALTEVIGSIAELLLGSVVTLEGDGTPESPWQIPLTDDDGIDAHLALFVDGQTLAVDLTADVEADPIGDGDLRAIPGVEARVGLARLDLGAGTASWLTSIEGAASLRSDGQPLRVLVGDVSLVADAIGFQVAWSQQLGLVAAMAAPGLAVDVGSLVGDRLDDIEDGLLTLPVPTFRPSTPGAPSRLGFDEDPDWDAVEVLIATLVERSGSSALSALLELVGWSGEGAHLDLGGLLTDPEDAIRSWLGDLVLDCANIHTVLRPLGTLFRGLREGDYYGAGSAQDPIRLPFGTNPIAPGLAVWTDTSCPRPLRKYEQLPGSFSREEPPDPEVMAGALHGAGVLDRSLDLLLFGRTNLGTGIGELADRMAGTDGVIGRPAALPDGVDAVELVDRSYDELVAGGRSGALVGTDLSGLDLGTAIVHVGCEAGWSDAFGASSFDARAGQPGGAIPATGDGTWSVRLPTPTVAGADRPDLGAVDAQAARLADTLATRTEPITVIAYGGAGAAAIVAARTAASVSHVVTVGAPWSAVATTGFSSGLSGDALACLDRLADLDTSAWTDEVLATEIVDEVRARLLLDRALAASPADLPSAARPQRRADLDVTAVFGQLDSDEVLRALGAFVEYGIGVRGLAAGAAGPVADPSSLHVGLSLPVIDTALAGVALGAGLTVELVSADRGPTGDGFDVRSEPTAVIEIRFGVEDGWLVGGPGAAQRDVEVRWMSAIVTVPVDGDGTTSCELVLHDARCFSVDSEEWRIARVDADGDLIASTPSEVHIMVGEVVDRLAGLADGRTAQLVDLLARAGLIRDGGFDPDGLDRLIFDTTSAMDDLLGTDRAELAAIVRTLGDLGGTGTEVTVAADTTTIGLDLAGPTVDFSIDQPLEAIGAITATATLGAAGVSASVAVGTLDATTGGIQLTGTVDSANPADAALAVRWQHAGGTPTTVPLLPTPSTDRLPGLVASIASASLVQAGINHLRDLLEDSARTAVDTVLEDLGLLREATDEQLAGATLPVGLLLDPGGWLRHAAPGWRVDPLGRAVALFDALIPMVAPGHTGGSWPLGAAVAIAYRTEDGRLVLAASVDVDEVFDGGATDDHAVQAALAAGVSVGLDGTVEPTVDVQVTVDGTGLAVRTAPSLSIGLLRPPQAPLPLYPNGPGLGQALAVAVTSLLPTVLDAVAAERNNTAASLRRSVGQAVFDIGGAMGLRDGADFDGDRINTFADDPAAALSAHAGDLVGLGLATIADALDDTAVPAITARSDGPGRVALSLGTTEPVTVVIDAGTSGPAIELSASFDIGGVGRIVVAPLRLGLAGPDVTVRFDSSGLDVGGGVTLFPTATLRAGATVTPLLAVGLGFDATVVRAVEFRWSLGTTQPRVVVVDRSGVAPADRIGIGVEHPQPAEVAVSLCTLALGMVVQLAGEALDDKVFQALDGVLFTSGTRTVDPTLIDDLDDPDALLDRLGELALNVAALVGPLDIGGVVSVGLLRDGNRVGIGIDMVGNALDLATGDTNVALVSEDEWITASGSGLLNVWLLSKTGGRWDIDVDVALRGLGLRVSKSAGALLDLGPASIDAIAFHLYTEVRDGDIGIGAQLRLDGLSIAPAGGGSGPDGEQNSVANNFMSDAADGTSPDARPAFSPSIAVQTPPGGDAGVTVRAGPPPGPWWIVIQRQLGPLYLEQFGFDSTEENGTIVGMSLLFDARVEIFGLAAQVDRLGIHWTGGDALDIDNWRVDLEGLAISADFSGVSISGGLIKTNLDGNIGYVGMLMGRFGVYGLSLFGGYTDMDGAPSFFVFGAVNGPIGGPPAFFLTGIGGGLGINRGLRVPPDVGQMNEYPFVKALDPGAQPAENPLDELRSLANYFPPENGTFWFAAGIAFNSFALVDGVAVVSVSFGNGLEINLFGLARLALPRPGAALVSIELGLLARFSTAEGLFLIQAQLTENSWLLYPEVRLTGGFAFATWWKGANRGQFVLTIGGYHPDFHRDGYPVVPRVGLEWRVTDDIVVKGGSYFALTSEALMAGVEVVVSADFGFLWAEVRFGADGIVWFDPFYFKVRAYAKIKAGCRIKTWFGTIRISISLGASIEVQGPKFNGVAKVEVGPFEASVPFGSKQRVPGEVIGWSEFVDKYLEAVAVGVALGATGITGKGTLPAATGGDESAPSSDGSAELPYQVFPEFEMTLVTPIPFVRLEAAGVDEDLPSSHDLGIRPMAQDDLEPTLHLTLQWYDSEARRWRDDTDGRIAQLLVGLTEESPSATAATYGTEGFPLGVWGEGVDPDPEAAPLPAGDVVVAASRLKLVAEADPGEPTGPLIDYRQIEFGRRPLPLAAEPPTRAQMLTTTGSLPQPASVAEAMAGARNHLFVGAADARSIAGRVGFGRSRTAPPRFGALTDGMLTANPDRVGADFIEQPPAAGPTTVRPPFVSGYLTVGAGVVARTAATSVGDGSIKRRPAPSTASVSGRLGRELPLRLAHAAVPADPGDSTLIARGALPRTDVGGAARTFRGGNVVGALGPSILARPGGPRRRGGPRALDPGADVRPGDVVVLTVPNPDRDRDEQRSELQVDGRARVVMVRASGKVLADRTVTDESVEVPRRTRFVLVQADGAVEATADAVGWHASARLAAASGSVALGAGCVVHTSSADASTATGWIDAAAFTRRSAVTTTTFDREVRSVAVAVRSTDVERVRAMGIELRGADRRRRDGRDAPPLVVQAGELTIMVVEVVPHGDRPVSVRVLAGGDRRLSGVLGSARSPDDLAEAIAERGLGRLVGRLRAGDGATCALTWNTPNRPRRRTADGGSGRTTDGGVTTSTVRPNGGR